MPNIWVLMAFWGILVVIAVVAGFYIGYTTKTEVKVLHQCEEMVRCHYKSIEPFPQANRKWMCSFHANQWRQSREYQNMLSHD